MYDYTKEKMAGRISRISSRSWSRWTGGWPQDARAVIHGGIVVQRFDPERSNPWHHAPGQVAVFTLTGSVEIEVGNGDKRVIGPGDVLIAEDVAGEGHYTREVGPEARISIFVPLREHPEV